MKWRELGIGIGIFALLTMMAMTLALSAFAENETIKVNIPAQELSTALSALAEQANVQVLYVSELAAGRTTTGATGTMTPEEAVRQLLQGTGLQYTFTDARTVTLQPAVLPAPMTQMEKPKEPAAAIQKPVKVPEIVVKDVRDRDYVVETSSAGTKTETPIRDVPQSIQVVPRALMEDQSAFRAHEAVQNVSGVYRASPAFGEDFVIRGFRTNSFNGGFLRDGLPDRRESMRDVANIERIEVLKGPGSVLYGRLEPGGTLNFVTKRPLAVPRYLADLRADSFGLLRPTFDLSTVAADGTLGIRVNGALEHGGNFRDFSSSDRRFGSGVLTWRPSNDTEFSVEVEGLDDRRLHDRGIPNLGTGPAPIPITRLLNEPSDRRHVKEQLYGYTLMHTFNPAWKVKHALRVLLFDSDDNRTTFAPGGVDPATGNLKRRFQVVERDREQFVGTLQLIGDIRLVGMRHQLLFGVDVDHAGEDPTRSSQGTAPNINIFNPVYGQFTERKVSPSFEAKTSLRSIAPYVQDLIELSPHWKALAGVRFDAVHNSSQNRLNGKTTETDDRVFSPRAGLVWQPNPTWSLYTSYSQSFAPVLGTDFSGTLFKPESGQQIEAGVKSDWFGGRLAATMAVFHIVRRNIAVSDLANPGFSIQTGEVTSDGIEFDVSGSPLQGLNLIGNFALTDARVTEDTRATLIGKRPVNVPDASGALWASYELQGEPWRGLGGGIGAFYVGRRAGLIDGSYFLPSYTRWDAAIWYRLKQWRLSLKANNLLNETYYESALDVAGIGPGAPFNVVGTVAYQF